MIYTVVANNIFGSGLHPERSVVAAVYTEEANAEQYVSEREDSRQEDSRMADFRIEASPHVWVLEEASGWMTLREFVRLYVNTRSLIRAERFVGTEECWQRDIADITTDWSAIAHSFDDVSLVLARCMPGYIPTK